MTNDPLREKLEGLYQEAVFLIDRLDDHENNIADDETANDWHGHVAPSLHRFRSQLPLLLDALGQSDLSAARAGVREVVVDMVLHCPKCHLQHVDEPTPEWDNPPHRSHLCHRCGCIWRPADVPTNGVRAIATVGKADNFLAASPATQPSPPASDDAMVEALEDIMLIVEDEAYKVTDGQKPCKHTAALNEVHDRARQALASRQPAWKSSFGFSIMQERLPAAPATDAGEG